MHAAGARTLGGSTFEAIWRKSRSLGEVSTNGVLPVSISYAIAASEYTFDRTPIQPLLASSGLAYAGDPKIERRLRAAPSSDAGTSSRDASSLGLRRAGA